MTIRTPKISWINPPFLMLIVFFLMISLQSGCISDVLAQGVYDNFESYPSTAETVVEAFCKEDFEGAGLSSNGWQRIKKYTTWSDAPGWDTVIIVTDYQISKPKEDINVAHVVVNYKVIGELISGEKTLELQKKKYIKKVNYKLVKEDESWKIEHPQDAPKIGIRSAIALLKGQISAERDSALINRMKKSITILEKIQETERSK